MRVNTPDDEDTGPGRLIADRYRLETKLGSGAMGRVWSGVDELLRRPVAIKEVLLPAGVAHEDGVGRGRGGEKGKIRGGAVYLQKKQRKDRETRRTE